LKTSFVTPCRNAFSNNCEIVAGFSRAIKFKFKKGREVLLRGEMTTADLARDHRLWGTATRAPQQPLADSRANQDWHDQDIELARGFRRVIQPNEAVDIPAR
jgi:hypothetical protein